MRGRILVNDGAPVETDNSGPQTYHAKLKGGENRFEASFLPTGSIEGTWRFDFLDAENVIPGSLRTESGRVLAIDGSTIVFAVGPKESVVRFSIRVRERADSAR